MLSWGVGCSPSGEKVSLDIPVEVQVLPITVDCSDGSVGYVAFVADNTPYGGKLKMLDGCAGAVNDDFSDGTKGKGKGILVGPLIGSFDIMMTLDGLTIAAAIPDERRLVLVHLTPSFERMCDDTSVELGIIPRSVARVGNFFFVLGNDLIEEQGYLVAFDGRITPQTLDRHYDTVVCDGEQCLARSRDDGGVYLGTLDLSAVEPRVSFSSDLLPDGVSALAPVAGIAVLGGRRFLVWNGKEAVAFEVGKETILARIVLPHDGRVTAAAVVSYLTNRPYETIDNETASARTLIYLESSDEDVFSVEEETPDVDALEEADNIAVMREISLRTETSDDDTLGGGLDATKAVPVWIAFDFGRILSYDLVSGGWMYVPVAAGESILPMLTDARVTIPEEGESTTENRPRITFIRAIQGLPAKVSYEFVYEGIFSGSLSDSGEWHESDSLFSDRLALFDRFVRNDPHRYAILVTDPPSGERCLLPAGMALSLDILEVVNVHTLRVDAGKWHEEIADCYQPPISYGIYPRNGYLARVGLPSGVVKEDIAREMPANWDASLSREVSYRDTYIDIFIQRRTDDVATSRGLVFSFSVKPSVTFFAPMTADLITRIVPLPTSHVLLFAPIRRTIYEYAPVFEETATTYR